jgi:hypothetical protein
MFNSYIVLFMDKVFFLLSSVPPIVYCPLNGLFNFFAPNNGFAGLTCRDKYKLHSHLSNATSTTTIAATTARLEF